VHLIDLAEISGDRLVINSGSMESNVTHQARDVLAPRLHELVRALVIETASRLDEEYSLRRLVF
jgi:hypothetical protein